MQVKDLQKAIRSYFEGWGVIHAHPMNPFSTQLAEFTYRGTSLIRNAPPLWTTVGPSTLLGTYSRAIPRALRWSSGGGGVSYERGTPMPVRVAPAHPQPLWGCVHGGGVGNDQRLLVFVSTQVSLSLSLFLSLYTYV